MSELNGLENLPTDNDSCDQDWVKHFGREFMDHEKLLNSLWHWTRGMTPEQQNLHFGVAKREVIPLIDRANELPLLEGKEASAFFDKYHNPDTGARAMLLKELDTLLQDLDVRVPLLAKVTRGIDKERPIVENIGCVNFGIEGGPCIYYNERTKFLTSNIQVKTYRALRNVSLKRVALMEDQNRVLTRALEEHGIQLPQEYISIGQQLAELKWYNPDETAPGNTGEEVGLGLQSETTQPENTAGYEDPEPNIKLVSLHEDLSNSAFVAHWDNREEPLSENEVETTPAGHIPRARLPHLLVSLGKFLSGQFFATPLTEEESPEYFDVVRDHRDLTTIKHDLETTRDYGSENLMHDFRLMLDNYTHVFGKGSEEHEMTERFEMVLFATLKTYGEEGETAKKHFENAPRAKFNEPNPSPEADETIPPSPEAVDANDNSIDEDAFDTSYAQGIRNDYEDDYGEGHDHSYFGQNDDALDYADENGPGPQTPGLLGPAQQLGSHANPSPSLYGPAEQSKGEDDLVKAAWGVFDVAKEYDRAHGHAARAPGRGTTLARVDDDDRDSPSPGASGDAHALEQPAPLASMPAEQNVIDLTSSPQRQTGHIGSAARKRSRQADQQDDSSDDETPLFKRLKAAAKSTPDEQPRSRGAQKPALHAVTPSLGKRTRNDSDDGGQEPEQSSKRKKASSLSAPRPIAPVASASQAVKPIQASYQQLSRVGLDAQIPPSPIPEPLSPVLAAAGGPGSVSPPPMLGRADIPESANGASNAEGNERRPGSNSPSAAADEPQPNPATEDLGHTNNGTTTVSKLQKLPKYKKKGGSKGRGRPNRPWVFGYRFGNDYGLYIMGCPTKGCEPADTMIFATHPLLRNDAASHLTEECGHVFADTDDMVRKTCTQVISDGKKAVSIEWARKWNSELLKEYGNEDREGENIFN